MRAATCRRDESPTQSRLDQQGENQLPQRIKDEKPSYRIDIYPTHNYRGFKLRPGKPMPFGATIVPGGVNFSVFSRNATGCELVLFKKHDKKPFGIIPFPDEFRIGHVFTMIVFDLLCEEIEYGFRMDGPYDRKAGHWFNKEKILCDPYAKAIGGRDVWGKEPDWNGIYQYRARVADDDFDWDGDRPLEIPMEDLIIYEMHVRGFTRHSSSDVKHPGTYTGIREKIPYLKDLGVNCVEMMPVFEFDEFENPLRAPVTGQRLMNYWGYSSVGFFAPKAGYAATGADGTQVDEFKMLVRELHRNGIEVILDVVYNHTAEGNESGPYISFRGIDNKTYYILKPDGSYHNFSGCGNTLNCNNPIVRSMILDSLRYWAAEYHIDGFRFDLASILGRDQNGVPLANPPLLESLAFDPVLGKCKLIAEAWDAGGLYQVGSFPSWGRWAEWNGRFRDDMRKFLKSDAGLASAVAQRLQGSPDLYAGHERGPAASINFFTCHDGFTLLDLVSYNQKHNEANAENNKDGLDVNDSWNCGIEGPADDPAIIQLRRRQIKNAVTLLMVSQGVPMILSGDEMGHTQLGNNNAYCQDNEITWLDWRLAEKNKELCTFFKSIIAFRKAHPALRSHLHLRQKEYRGSGLPDISWHGLTPWNADFSHNSRVLAYLLCGKHAKGGNASDCHIYVAINMHWEPHGFSLPKLPGNCVWHLAVNTGAAPPNDIARLGEEQRLPDQNTVNLWPRSIVVLTGK
jgi:glycogen operon protein